MKGKQTERTFFDLFYASKPILKVKFDLNSDEEAILVHMENELKMETDKRGLARLLETCSDKRLSDFVDFYSNYNGFSLGTGMTPKNVVKKPLLRQFSASDLTKFTDQYLPNGKLAWTVDYIKTKTIYRSEHKWLAFAQVDNGPGCLTIFLDGESAGNVFLLNPEPRFNTLKPIAKSFTSFLDRVAKDPAAFFKLIRAYVTLVGSDKQNYGYVPIDYIDN